MSVNQLVMSTSQGQVSGMVTVRHSQQGEDTQLAYIIGWLNCVTMVTNFIACPEGHYKHSSMRCDCVAVFLNVFCLAHQLRTVLYN